MDKETYKEALDKNPELKLWYVNKSDIYKIHQVPAVSQEHYELDSCFFAQEEALRERLKRLQKKEKIYESELKKMGTAMSEIQLAIVQIRDVAKLKMDIDIDEWDYAFGGRYGV